MWKNRSLRNKILTGYFILVTVIASVGVWSIYNVWQLNRVLVDITQENYSSVLAAANMIGAIERQNSAILLLLIDEKQQGYEIYRAGRADFRLWFDQEERNITLPNEGELVERVKSKYRSYNDLFDAVYQLAAAGETEAAHKLYLGEIEPLFAAIRGDLQDILVMNHQEFMAGNTRSSATAQHAAVSVAVGSGSAVVLGIFFALALSQAVVKPIIRLTDAVKRIREGNFNETVAVTSLDEMGELAREFNSMILRLREYEDALHGKLAVEQQKALAIIQAMVDGIVLTDQNQRVVMVNPAAEQILGLHASDVIGKNILQVANQPEMIALIEQVSTSKVLSLNRTVLIKVHQQEHFYEIDAWPFQAGIEVTGYAVIFKDITYVKQLAKKKEDFLAGIAHEIRTPLTAITMGVGILNESRALRGNQNDVELLAVLQEETSRLTTLVDELLELSRFESGRMVLKVQQLEVAGLLERTVAPFRMQAEKAHVRLGISVAENLPFVKWDVDKIQSVLSNLLANSLRYTPAGGAITMNAEKKADTILLSVTDNGPGIPAHLQNKVFDKFYQMEDRPAGKVGLGLAICQAIVTRHNGKIWVKSEEGQGATFFVELPIQNFPDGKLEEG